MSHIEDLIREHCPEGVETRALASIRKLVGGPGESDVAEP